MTASLPHLLILKIFHPPLTGLLIKVWAFDEDSLIYFLDLIEVAKVNCIFFARTSNMCKYYHACLLLYYYRFSLAAYLIGYLLLV